MNQKTEINLLPFIVEALGNNKKIYKDVDKIYQKHRYDFYKAAKESDLYNHHIIQEGSLLQEEYCKKFLGIISGAGEDESIHKAIQELIRKGFRYTWSYLEKYKNIDLEDFTKAFYRKFNGIVDKDRISIDFHVVILIFITLNSESKLSKNEFYNDFIILLTQRWEHYYTNNELRIGIEKINDLDKIKIQKLKDCIYEEHGAIRCFEDILNNKFEEKSIDTTTFLFDYERLSSDSIFKDIKLVDRDIDEILYLYVISNGDLDNLENATKFLISHIYAKCLIKAYKQVKDMYFKNNKETMFVELEGIEKKLKTTQNDLSSTKKKLQDLDKFNQNLEKENKRLKAELAIEKRNREELNSLREFMFSMDKEEDFTQDEFDFDAIKGCKAVLIGGHERWQQKMKESLPNFIFIHPDNMNFDTKLLNDVSHVFIYVNYLNHSIYHKTMNVISGKDTKVFYINQQNEDMVFQHIYNAIFN